MIVKDFLGNELNVGDEIVYPLRSGSAMWMTTSSIIDICSYKNYWDDKETPYLKVIKSSGRKTEVHALNRVIKITGRVA